MTYSGTMAKELIEAFFKGGNAQGMSASAIEMCLNLIITKSKEIVDDEMPTPILDILQEEDGIKE